MALSIILHHDFYVKHFKSKSLHTIEHCGFYQNSVLFSKKKFNFQALCFTNFSKAPNWGQMLNYVFPITPFSTFLMSFCFFVTGQFQSYLATCPFGMSVIKNRVGYFAFTFGFVVYVVTHSDRLLTLHVAY